jgi:hypothetical protein
LWWVVPFEAVVFVPAPPPAVFVWVVEARAVPARRNAPTVAARMVFVI